MKKKWNLERFTPPWWLRNGHFQSLFNTLFPPTTRAILTWEELQLPDGDFIDLCWAGEEGSPVAVLLHGLEGSVHSHYIQSMLDTLVANHWRVVVMHFRTCSGRINRFARSYHACDIDDFDYLLQVLATRYPSCPITAVGYSLGGNVLLNYLIEKRNGLLKQAIAVSIPFELNFCESKLSSFYQWAFVRTMKQKIISKIKAGYDMPVTVKEVKKISDMHSFDERITAPLHGFSSAEDYYERATVRYSLKKIQNPTVIIHALDDPLVPREIIPRTTELSDYVYLDIHPQGGHVGFTQGMVPWQPIYWLNNRILKFLNNALL